LKIIGLTGNSGSGKTTVSKILSENGGWIIDADKIAHENMLKGNVTYDEIIETFGKSILSSDDEIDRKKLGAIVFSDNEKLNQLNQICFKHILKKISNEIDSVISTSKKCDKFNFIVIDAPLLIESGLNKIADETWVVCAAYETRLNRIMKRDNISRTYAENRLNNQTPQAELASLADVIIENNNISLSELTKKILSKLGKR